MGRRVWIRNLINEEALAYWGLLHKKKKKKKLYTWDGNMNWTFLSQVFWDVTPCRLVSGYRYSEGAYSPSGSSRPRRPWRWRYYQSTRHTIPEDMNIQKRRCEKLKLRPQHSSPNVGNNVRPVKRWTELISSPAKRNNYNLEHLTMAHKKIYKYWVEWFTFLHRPYQTGARVYSSRRYVWLKQTCFFLM